MHDKQRQTGGDNNKRGNRYEDHFAISRLIRFAPRAMDDGAEVRIREQAGCPVDDLLLVESGTHHFHQLKASKDITWGQEKGKLAKEFLAQQNVCREQGIEFRLAIVVADVAREQSLTNNMPGALADCTTVFLFPEFQRPSQLLRLEEINEAIAAIYAGRNSSVTEYEHVVNAFVIGWVEHEEDADGFCRLDRVIAQVHEMPIGLLRRVWDDKPEEWREAERILTTINGLRWWADRGYFEWEFPPTDHGLCREPCESDNFRRFISRLVAERPSSFADFERLLP